MIKTNKDFIEDSYEKSEYKDLVSLEEYKLICRAPFKLVRESIQRGDMENIILQYFGSFKPSKSKMNFQLKALEEKFQKGHISESYYLKRKKILSKDVK